MKGLFIPVSAAGPSSMWQMRLTPLTGAWYMQVHAGILRWKRSGKRKNSAGPQPVLSFRTLPEEEVRFTDGHFGSQAFNLARDWGDIIIRRSDGVFAYQLAVTIDDGLLGVTQVVRGWDLLSSSAPQIYLFRLLGFDTPRYLHLPLLITEDGARLAKRDKAADVGFLRSQLPGPEPLVGYIAYLLGQIDKPEAMTATELLPLFDDKKIPGHDIVIPGNIGNIYKLKVVCQSYVFRQSHREPVTDFT